MSEFSERCKEYVAKSNTNIYQLAKQSGLERTTLQRMVNGNRLPSIQVVKEFCSHLQITMIEEEELLELYKIEKIGKDVYFTRKEIESLIIGIQNLRSNWNAIVPFKKEHISVKWDEEVSGVRQLKLDLDITEAIQYIIKKEINNHRTAYIDMDVFARCECVMQQLIREEKMTKNKIVCNHYINFTRKNSDEISSIENIQMLKLVIPFAFTFHNTYHVQYSYTNKTRKDNYFQLWPHFLITTTSMILFSENGNRAIMIEDADVAQYYREEIREMSKKYRPLFNFTGLNPDADKILKYYYKNVMNEFPEYVFESHPCVIRMFYPELLKREIDNTYVGGMYEHYETILYENQSKKCVNYFGMAGMCEFLDKGKLPGIYGSYTRNYTEEERKNMLEHFLRSIHTEKLDSYLLKEEVFPIEEGINIELYEGKKIYFISTSEKFPFGIIGIEEKGICEAFRDYFESLKESDGVYGVNDTKRILEEKINENKEKESAIRKIV